MGICPDNAVLNAIVRLSTEPQVLKGVDPQDVALAYATAIRKSLEKVEDPKSIKDMTADLAKTQSQVAWDKNGQDLDNPKEGCLLANITRR